MRGRWRRSRGRSSLVRDGGVHISPARRVTKAASAPAPTGRIAHPNVPAVPAHSPPRNEQATCHRSRRRRTLRLERYKTRKSLCASSPPPARWTLPSRVTTLAIERGETGDSECVRHHGGSVLALPRGASPCGPQLDGSLATSDHPVDLCVRLTRRECQGCLHLWRAGL